MFKRHKRTPSPGDIPNTPQTAFDNAKAEWLERMGGPIVESNRWFVMSVVLGVCLIAALFAIAQMAPLKTVVPYQIQVDKVTGEARANRIDERLFVVDEKQKKYFLGRWVRKTFELDPYTTEANIKEAFIFVRGKAIDEYRGLMYQLKPMERLAKEKSLTKVVTITSISFISESSAMIRFGTEERSGGDPVSKRYVVNVHFEVVPPVTEKDILENPAGIFVTHFALSEEVQ